MKKHMGPSDLNVGIFHGLTDSFTPATVFFTNPRKASANSVAPLLPLW